MTVVALVGWSTSSASGVSREATSRLEGIVLPRRTRSQQRHLLGSQDSAATTYPALARLYPVETLLLTLAATSSASIAGL